MSAIAAAAYRATEKIKNERDGVVHDYTRKGGVVYAGIMLPDNAPPEYADRAVLWNAEVTSSSVTMLKVLITAATELSR